MDTLTSNLPAIIKPHFSNSQNFTQKMTTFETEQEPHSQNSLQFLECLYCEETCWDDDDDYKNNVHEEEQNHDGFGSSTLSPLHDISSYLLCEEDEEEHLNALFCKEEKAQFFSKGDFVGESKTLMVARKDALEWMIRVKSHYNFSAITLVLGVNYFDRFILSFGFQEERPWMTHVVAIVCLSLASKIEETHVPLLLDFQVENKLMFEAKVIQRMELLVLSALEWKMNAVTPLSYFGHIIKRLKLKTQYHWEILGRCESLIISAVLDPRYLYYVPSILAAAAMVQALKEMGLSTTLETQIITIMDTLKLDKDKVEECQKLIQELANLDKAHKRKIRSYDNSGGSRSPNNVLEVVCSSESSSNDDKDSSSAEPQPKKCRTVGVGP